MNAAMQGPDAERTAVFLVWDDWGGFYDHVRPPRVDALGYGLRVPSIVISPYADRGLDVDHGTYSFDAFLKLIEDRFLDGARLNGWNQGWRDPRPTTREEVGILADLATGLRLLPAADPLDASRPQPAPTMRDRMRLDWTLAATVVVGALVAAACTGSAATIGGAAPSGVAAGGSPAPNAPIDPESGILNLDHLIFIVQENRSFDHYFGTFPGADGIPDGRPGRADRVRAGPRARPVRVALSDDRAREPRRPAQPRGLGA